MSSDSLETTKELGCMTGRLQRWLRVAISGVVVISTALLLRSAPRLHLGQTTVRWAPPSPGDVPAELPPAFLAPSQPSLPSEGVAPWGQGGVGKGPPSLPLEAPQPQAPKSPLPPSLTPWAPSCGPPSLAHATPTNSTIVHAGGELVLADGCVLHLALPVLTNCALSSVLLTPLHPATYFAAHGLEGPGVEVALTMWTSSTEPGKPCVLPVNGTHAPDALNCRRLERKLALSFVVDKDGAPVALQAQLYPDPSVAHYAFMVMATGAGSGRPCLSTPPLVSKPFELRQNWCHQQYSPLHNRPNIMVPIPLACYPTLHHHAPLQTDFFIRTLSQEEAPQGHSALSLQGSSTPRARVGPGAVLTARRGRNALLVTYPALTALQFPHHVTNATIYGRLLGTSTIVNLDVELEHDPRLGGYIARFDLRDPGAYTLQVVVAWYFGGTDPGQDPRPVLVGPFMAYRYNTCSHTRASIDGAPLTVVLAEDASRAGPSSTSTPAPSRKCTRGDLAGRWVDGRQVPCAPPVCSGARPMSEAYDWDSDKSRDWVWVPYDCHLHYYSTPDIYRCAAETKTEWIHAMGDSQEREFVAHMKMVRNDGERASKFEQTDLRLNSGKLRVTWQFYEESFMWRDASRGRNFSIDRTYFDHYILAPSQLAGLPLNVSAGGRFYNLTQREDVRPSVTLLSHAAAYAAWYQSMDSHKAWMQELVQYLGNGSALIKPAPVPGRPGLNTPMRLIWYAAPFTHSPAHEGTDWVTTHRVLTMDRHAQALMRAMGVDVLDTAAVMQSQWEAAYDGLHYLKGHYTGWWYGKVAGVVFQLALNTLFGDCGSNATLP